jgi:hypothetical protein
MSPNCFVIYVPDRSAVQQTSCPKEVIPPIHALARKLEDVQLRLSNAHIHLNHRMWSLAGSRYMKVVVFAKDTDEGTLRRLRDVHVLGGVTDVATQSKLKARVVKGVEISFGNSAEPQKPLAEVVGVLKERIDEVLVGNVVALKSAGLGDTLDTGIPSPKPSVLPLPAVRSVNAVRIVLQLIALSA